VVRWFVDLTPSRFCLVTPSPFIPLPLSKGKGEILKRGANAPLRHPYIINPEQGESKRGAAVTLWAKALKGRA